MKVKTNISPKFQETYAIICSDALNEEVEEAVESSKSTNRGVRSRKASHFKTR